MSEKKGFFGRLMSVKKTDCCSGRSLRPGQTACGCAIESAAGGVKKSRFIVLGACCKKSADTFENVKKAVAELGLSDEVVNIADDIEIARYGVMQTPALVVYSRVVSQGKLLSVEAAKKLIQASSDSDNCY